VDIIDDSTAQIIEELKAQNRRFRERIEELENENSRLREQLEQAQTAAARQAAPFRREEKKKIPPEQQKRPGQKPGHAGCCRKEPEHIDEIVEVPLDKCPKCNGLVTDCRKIEQIIEEIPPIRPYVVKLTTYIGTCQKCGEVHSSHPLQTSLGQGAAKVQIGPRALAWRHLLTRCTA